MISNKFEGNLSRKKPFLKCVCFFNDILKKTHNSFTQQLHNNEEEEEEIAVQSSKLFGLEDDEMENPHTRNRPTNFPAVKRSPSQLFRDNSKSVEGVWGNSHTGREIRSTWAEGSVDVAWNHFEIWERRQPVWGRHVRGLLTCHREAGIMWMKGWWEHAEKRLRPFCSAC